MKEILIATNNKGKLEEIKQILKEYNLLSLKDIGCKVDVDEDGKTFEENAIKKAKEISEITNMPCIADDSGLCIDVLNGWPGVHTARFLGENATDEDRNNYILEKMKNEKNRNAKVVCAIAYFYDDKEIVVTGEIQGKISKTARGENGFGFDSIFELERGKTLAELTSKEKNKVSSRKIALEKLKEKLEK